MRFFIKSDKRNPTLADLLFIVGSFPLNEIYRNFRETQLRFVREYFLSFFDKRFNFCLRENKVAQAVISKIKITVVMPLNQAVLLF